VVYPSSSGAIPPHNAVEGERMDLLTVKALRGPNVWSKGVHARGTDQAWRPGSTWELGMSSRSGNGSPPACPAVRLSAPSIMSKSRMPSPHPRWQEGLRDVALALQDAGEAHP